MKTSRLFLFLLILIFCNGVVLAEPYLAVKTGQKCMACHTNPSGGGKRTAYGIIYGQTQMLSVGKSQAVPTFNGRVTDHLSFGGNLRANLRGNSTPKEENSLAFEIENLLLYTEFSLIANRLSFYVDQQLAPGSALNREAYGLAWNENHDAYLKVGKMFLPYGLRLEDDSAFIRQVSGINYDTPDVGLEMGLEKNAWSLGLALSNGTAGGQENNKGKQYSFRGEHVRPQWRVGASVNFNDGDKSADRVMGNIFAGVRTGKVVWLAEVDQIIDKSGTKGTRVEQRVALLEANVEVKQGHNLKLSYEYFDPDQNISENERNRYSVVYELSPWKFQQFRAGVRVSNGIPQSALQNTDEFFIQSHMYF